MQHNFYNLRWSVRRRLEFIEFRIYWDGQVNRGDLTNFFDISEPQASADLSRYMELAPGNIFYDKSLKKFIPENNFEPKLCKINAREYLTHLRLIADNVEDKKNNWIGIAPNFDALPILRRKMSVDILKPIVNAIKNKFVIKIFYASLKNPIPNWRWISPHALAFDGRRWHVRAWCHKHNDFRDFVIARIYYIGDVRKSDIDPKIDLEWCKTIYLRLIPNPHLSKDQKKIIELEYGMESGQLLVNTRISLVFYLIEYLNLKKEPNPDDAIAEHLYLDNIDYVNSQLDKAKNDAKIQLEAINFKLE